MTGLHPFAVLRSGLGEGAILAGLVDAARRERADLINEIAEVGEGSTDADVALNSMRLLAAMAMEP